MTSQRIIQGDCIEGMRTLPDASVHCCVTSPPYWGLRDYGHDGQIGLESTPEAYVARMVEVFREVRRILRDDGVLFLNLGDSYASGSTICPQSYKMRDDVTFAEKCYVAMEMFGVRIVGDETASQGSMPEVLPEGDEGKAIRCRPGVESKGVESQLPAESTGTLGVNAREAATAEVDGNRATGREVCLLRGEDAGVSDGGSHQRRRCSTPEKFDRKGPCKQREGVQGHSQPRFSEGQVSGAVLQLQLRHRVLGILSSRTYAADEIPDSARFAFAPVASGLKPKDLVGIPWRVAFALQSDGWWLRQDIIWHKPNPMPESVRDRCTKAHEYVFLLTKSERYYYDADAVKEQSSQPGRIQTGYKRPNKEAMSAGPMARGEEGFNHQFAEPDRVWCDGTSRNRRSVWTVTTKPYSGAHFAVMPPDLVEPCILAGCPEQCCPVCGAGYERKREKTGKVLSTGGSENNRRNGHTDFGGSDMNCGTFVQHEWKTLGWQPACDCDASGNIPGTVLDPFAGSGTTLAVAAELGRSAIGCELNPEYIALAERRIKDARSSVALFEGVA